MGSDRMGTPNDCAKPVESWIFTSDSSGILCDIGIGSGEFLVMLLSSGGAVTLINIPRVSRDHSGGSAGSRDPPV